MGLMDIASILRPYLFGFSGIMTSLVLIIAARIAFDIKDAKTKQDKKIVMLICIALICSSFLFFNNILGIWTLFIVIGFLTLASVYTSSFKNKPKKKISKNPQSINVVDASISDKKTPNFLATNIVILLSLSFVTFGVAGVFSGYAPVVSMGPSMWPSSPKTVSIDIMNRDAYKYKDIDYGDSVSFEISNRSQSLTSDVLDNWPLGRYRKRVWALPGDTIKIEQKGIMLNGDLIANCSDNSDEIAPRVWWCNAKFPNGVSRKFVWGVNNYMLINFVKQEYTLGPHEIFVIGDNTVESSDSRERGPVNFSWVEGRYERDAKLTTWKAWH